MDQQKFESEVMQDLTAEAPPSSADDSLDEASNIEGYEEDAMEDAAVEEMDMFEEGGEESFHDEDAFTEGFEENLGEDYAEEGIAAWEALERLWPMPWRLMIPMSFSEERWAALPGCLV